MPDDKPWMTASGGFLEGLVLAADSAGHRYISTEIHDVRYRDGRNSDR
jgi:hypothetical protein